MTKRSIALSDDIQNLVTGFNGLSGDVGDLALLTSPVDSDIVGSINSLKVLIDSADTAIDLVRSTFTARARSSITATGGLSYDSSTGVVSGANGANFSALNGTSITTGTVADARIATTLVRTSRTVSPGDGMSGGGDLSANRSLAVDATVVRTSGNQTIAGTKTFSSTISGSINGNAATVPYSGISSKPTTLSGYGITDAISTSTTTQGNNLWIRNGSPTVYLRDTDGMLGALHVNSNLLYVLRGAVDADTFTQVNGQWPLTINLSNNDCTVGGNFSAVGNVAAYSDERLKTNVRTIDDALDKVCQMRGVYFDKDDKASVGVIAQEMEKVLPEVVMDGEYKSVAYGNIVGVLIEAIKELQAKVDRLEKGV